MSAEGERKLSVEHQETLGSDHQDHAAQRTGAQQQANGPASQEQNHHLLHRNSTHHRQRHAKFRSRLGLAAEHPVDEEHSILTVEHHNLWWPRIRSIFREPFAEFWGTFVMILFGDGSVAQVLLSTGEKTAPGGDGFGPYQSISWG